MESNRVNSSFRFAFMIWNTFQLLNFKSLLLQIPNATLVIEKRKHSIDIDARLLREVSNTVISISKDEIHQKVDGFFDVLIVQTTFEQIDLFTKTKIAMLQYGYAKEPHNYGAWRSLADLNLVYGYYAYKAISYFSPTEIVGCPKYDQWFNVKFHLNNYVKYECFLNSDKKTILYAPTWGDISSFSFYIDTIYGLADKYNILVKLHHNSILLGKYTRDLNKVYPNINFFYEDEDILSLISVSDVVISDFSGAIFDAVFCRKPVVLVSPEDMSDSKKLDCFSLEITRRAQLGKIVQLPIQLEQELSKIISKPEKYLVDDELYNNLFLTTDIASKKVIDCLESLAIGTYNHSQQQLYIRDAVCELYDKKRKLHNKTKNFLRRKFNHFWRTV